MGEVVIEVGPPPLLLDAAIAIAAATTTTPTTMKVVLFRTWAWWTPAGLPGDSGSAEAAEDKIKLAAMAALQRFRIIPS
jgi:hypothetical protein